MTNRRQFLRSLAIGAGALAMQFALPGASRIRGIAEPEGLSIDKLRATIEILNGAKVRELVNFAHPEFVRLAKGDVITGVRIEYTAPLPAVTMDIGNDDDAFIPDDDAFRFDAGA